MKKMLLTLLLILAFGKIAYAGEVNIFNNDELLGYKGIITESNYVYIPLVMFKDIAGSELTWNAEKQEVVMETLITGEYPNIKAIFCFINHK